MLTFFQIPPTSYPVDDPSISHLFSMAALYFGLTAQNLIATNVVLRFYATQHELDSLNSYFLSISLFELRRLVLAVDKQHSAPSVDIIP